MSDPIRDRPKQFFYEGDGVLPLYNHKTGECVAIDYKNHPEEIGPYFDIPEDSPEQTSLRLVALLDYLQDRFHQKQYETVSNYRDHEYNENLRLAGKPAQKRSAHIDAMATDGFFPNVNAGRIWKYAQRLGRFGTGYYRGVDDEGRKVDTFHLDTGPARSWKVFNYGKSRARKTQESTGETAGDRNRYMIIRTDRDIYRPGETVTFKLGMVGNHPFTLRTDFEVLSGKKRIGRYTMDGKKPDSCLAIDGVIPQCLPPEEQPSRSFSWTIPPDFRTRRDLRIVIRYCTRQFPEMKQTLLTNPIQVAGQK